MSIKSQIRQAVVARLKHSNLLKERVFDTPLKTFEPSQLPLLILTVEKDQVLEDNTSILMNSGIQNALIQFKELMLNLTIVAKAADVVVDELDQIASVVTKLLLADRTLGGLCKTLRFQEISEMAHADEAEKAICSLNLHCLVWYRQVDAMPEKSID